MKRRRNSVDDVILIAIWSALMLSWPHQIEESVWVPPHRDDMWREKVIREFKIHPVTAQILVSRGFSTLEEIHAFLYARLPDLHDPFLMTGMRSAVDRVCRAFYAKEKILIYGDNDVDGMTGTALLAEFLQYIGCQVLFYVSKPGSSRQFLIIEALEYALQNECRLLITVDCGVSAALEVAKMTSRNIDVIVTDHHEPIDALPDCVAILNPKLKDNPYPNRELTGVGVVFKLVHAITDQLVAQGTLLPRKVDLKRYLDLVALGTVSDMGVLLGENRILVRYGLQQLRKTKRIGLAKLIAVADPELGLGDLSAFTIATKIAPRLNSLGRIDDPRKGVELLLVRNPQIAEKMAIELDLNNLERQKIERVMASDLELRMALDPEILAHKAIIMSGDHWHPGIIAILSMRVSKHYNRPTVIIAIDNGIGKASLRSIPEFPVLPVLRSCSDILLNFGGHDFAAGFTIKAELIPEFTQRFYSAADESLKPYDVMSKLQIDAELSLRDLTFDLMESMNLLAPHGNENPQPIVSCRLQQAWPPRIVGKNHLKLYLEEPNNQGLIVEGIAFGRASAFESLKRRHLLLDVAFTPQINTHIGPSIQMLIRDFKIVSQESLKVENREG